MNLISLLVFLIVIGIAFWAVRAISGAMAIPAPIVVVIQVILVVFALIWLLDATGLMGGNMPGFRIH